MNSSNYIKCIECPNPDLCENSNTCAAIITEQRRNSRRILDTLSPGERFMLMFGRGKFNPLTGRVEMNVKDDGRRTPDLANTNSNL